MRAATTLLFGLDGFRVVQVEVHEEVAAGAPREVVVEGLMDEQACPDCGVLSASVPGRKIRWVKDVPHGRRPLRLSWDQRRWACREHACRRQTFAETSLQIGEQPSSVRRVQRVSAGDVQNERGADQHDPVADSDGVARP